VWNTIKMYIREYDQDTKKGEIVNHYVVKRNPIDYISPNWSKWNRQQKKSEIWIRRKQNEKDAISAGQRNLYVICYQTRDIKTNTFSVPKAFECEVVSTRISKKETQQKIIITKSLDFDKEMEWIAPIRSIERKRQEKANAAKAKIEAKETKKKKKQINKKNKSKNK
jgi:hypothetical protein